jgi:soluble lytic murein transglycosylase-like protein
MGAEPWTSLPNYQTWAATIAAAEAANGLPSGLLAAIGYQESGYQSAVIDGTQPSSAGALGMMQLMPQFFTSVRESIPFTPSAISAQISQAAQQLATLYQQFGNWQTAVAAYNAGAGTVQNALASGQAFPAETQAYLANVSSYVPSIAAATAAGAAGSPTGPTGATGAGTGATGSSA